MDAIAEALRAASLYRGLSEDDRQRLASVSLSRWGKESILETEKDGFVLSDRAALESLTQG